MKTAFVLPGLNSLLNPKARTRFLGLPEVQSRLKMTEELMKGRGRTVDLNQLLNLPTEQLYSRQYVGSAAAAIVSLQMGVADRLIRSMGQPEWVIGCSLGDLARSVIAGCCSFESALSLPLIGIEEAVGVDQIGPNLAVLTPGSHPFTDADIARIEALGIDVSYLSPKLLNISGTFADIRRFEKMAADSKWKILRLIDYPVHSRHLVGYLRAFTKQIRSVPMTAPRASTKVFSTLLRKPVTNSDELHFEMENNLVRPVQWHPSVKRLIEDHEVKNFVNIGPCQTLTKLLKQYPASLEVREAEEVM